MKYLIGAAIAAIAFTTVSAPEANNQSWGVATSYDSSSAELTALDHLWSQVVLHHTSSTQHQIAVIPPHQFPPDPCRNIAIAWNIAVTFNAREHTFERLLSRMARDNCTVTFGTTGVANTDGSQDVVQINPGQ